ncbi:hypothetical protein C8035_v005326 [Colletotrichum spinosum]|uniref:Uncharacterized protein n=1 Tax=Colletotrichum spinosum TaxID=1347390 RepID=A0A4R8PPM3_9PEZI|nr:hypothetical protein C8035_v005326 [Colletotrichum spinosum]
MKIVNNYKNYSYFYKGLKGLVLYKRNFTIFPSPLKIIIPIFNLNILLKDKTVSRVIKVKLK